MNADSVRSLWLNVISQAIRDATTGSSDELVTADRLEARRWLTTPSADFDEVCGLAELEPHKVRSFAASQIEEADRGGVKSRSRRREVTRTRAASRNAKVYTIGGESRTIREWAESVGINIHTLHSRLSYGWTLEDALATEVNLKPRRGVDKDFRKQGLGPVRDHRARSAENRVLSQ